MRQQKKERLKKNFLIIFLSGCKIFNILINIFRDLAFTEDKAKKKVQFREDKEIYQEKKKFSNESLNENNWEKDNEQEPRVQIIGTQEVYNDPRQRRLNQVAQANKSLKPVIKFL